MKKEYFGDALKFLGVYLLSMFLVFFAHGYAPNGKERFYFSSLLTTLVIFGAYEAGKNAKIIK